MFKWILGLCLILSSVSVSADEIEFPDEELSRETTLPVFSKRRIVLNRNVETERRFEFGLGSGLEMNEPYYNDLMFNVVGTYNLSETSAVNLTGLFWMSGLSSYGELLKQGSSTVPKFDASLAPHPKFALFGNYEFIAYYGKISLTKQTVMNLNLFGIGGLGYMNLGTVNTIGANVGLGQNFFLTKNFGIRVDLRWIIFRGPNAATKQLTPGTTVKASEFEDRFYFNTQLGVSGIFIL
jgi:outer membrane beta-barrel protein